MNGMVLKYMIRKPYVWVASFLCLVIGGCKDFEDCRSLYTSIVYIEFVANSKRNTQKIAFDLLKTDSFTAKKENISNPVIVPLNPAADFTTFCLYRSEPTVMVDTVTIYYQRYPSLLSPQCGAQQEYVLDSLYTTFASDSIVNKALRRERDKKNTADVQIFY
jgi:hypothetical protein